MAWYNGFTNKTVIDRYLGLPQTNKVSSNVSHLDFAFRYCSPWFNRIV